MNTTYTGNYIQFALSPEDVLHAEQLAEEAAIERFRNSIRHHRATYDAYMGQDGNGDDLGPGTRRQIMSALRKSCAVLGVGQKSRIGRLGAGAAIGAIIAGFATPAFAQYSAGGGVATGTNAVAIGTGSTADGISAVAIGQNNDADSDDVTSQQIFDRVTGGTYTYPTGDTGITSARSW